MNYQDVKWSELTHAYGDASDVPEFIESLQSDDEDEREEALNELYSNIWHQGTVYEATVKSLPILIELYISKSVIDLDGLAFLIILIACGNGYHQVHSREDNGSKINELIKREQDVVAQIREIVEPHFTLFIPYLENESDDIRIYTACVFRLYSTYADEFLPYIETALTKEKSDEVAPYLVSCIEELKNNNGSENE